MIGAILAGLSIAQGVMGAAQQHEAAGQIKANAKNRAKTERKMLNLQTQFNSKEYWNQYKMNLSETFDKTSTEIFKASQQLREGKAQIGDVVAKQRNHGVLSSSFIDDSTSALESQFMDQTNQLIGQQNMNTQMLAHTYAIQQSQEVLNRNSKDSEITLALNDAMTSAKSQNQQAIGSLFSGASGAFSAYKTWGA